jgi:serine protease SohB
VDYLFDLLLFVAKTIILVGGVVIAVGLVLGSVREAREMLTHESIDVKNLNERFDAMKCALEDRLLSDDEIKALTKQKKKDDKAEKKAAKKAMKANPDSAAAKDDKKRLFVIDFKGDIHPTQADNLREEISAILTVAEKTDEVVVRLESPGGTVHGYGFASSQLQRIREADLQLTVAVDKVAASGGYMMASVANTIVSAPFAIIGSIGVVLSMPNFNKLLKKHDIEYEQVTAGEFKRTLTVFGENTDDSRSKTKQELETVHELFKSHIGQFRPNVDMGVVATGETWHGNQAIVLNLVDSLQTSDDYLLSRRESHNIYLIKYRCKKPITKRFGQFMRGTIESIFVR